MIERDENNLIKNRKLLIISLLIMVMMFFIPNKSKAGLQANKGGTSLISVTADNFFIGIRRMETAYGTLGKNAILDEKNLDTTHNGIDVHMALNTEWGTVALLTDSIYGNGNDKTPGKTSTGNASGVYDLTGGMSEYVATIFNGETNSYNKKIGSSDARYFNNYVDSSTAKPGDALNCAYWLGASNASWTRSGDPVFIRGYYGTLFSFNSSSGNTYCYEGGFTQRILTSRAVVVCGENL